MLQRGSLLSESKYDIESRKDYQSISRAEHWDNAIKICFVGSIRFIQLLQMHHSTMGRE
jgi:hypothetical protein